MQKLKMTLHEASELEDTILKGIITKRWHGKDFIIVKGQINGHKAVIAIDIINDVYLATDFDDLIMADTIVKKLQWYITTGWREVGLFDMNSPFFMNHPYLSMTTLINALSH